MIGEIANFYTFQIVEYFIDIERSWIKISRVEILYREHKKKLVKEWISIIIFIYI